MLTTLQTVKDRLRVPDNADDDRLTNFIKLASAQIERWCNRTFGRTEDAVQEFQADFVDVPVAIYPIEVVSGVDVFYGQREGWQPQQNYDFEIRDGCVVHFYGRLATQRHQARLTYTGGYVLPGATPGDGQVALPDEIEQACVEQVAWLYQAKDRLGVTGVSGDGGSISQFAAADLLPIVKNLLLKHRRFVL